MWYILEWWWRKAEIVVGRVLRWWWIIDCYELSVRSVSAKRTLTLVDFAWNFRNPVWNYTGWPSERTPELRPFLLLEMTRQIEGKIFRMVSAEAGSPREKRQEWSSMPASLGMWEVWTVFAEAELNHREKPEQWFCLGLGLRDFPLGWLLFFIRLSWTMSWLCHWNTETPGVGLCTTPDCPFQSKVLTSQSENTLVQCLVLSVLEGTIPVG